MRTLPAGDRRAVITHVAPVPDTIARLPCTWTVIDSMREASRPIAENTRYSAYTCNCFVTESFSLLISIRIECTFPDV